MHNSIRDGQIKFPSLLSTDARENEVPSHFELPLLEYFLETTTLTFSSVVCWSLFREQAPPMEIEIFKATKTDVVYPTFEVVNLRVLIFLVNISIKSKNLLNNNFS